MALVIIYILFLFVLYPKTGTTPGFKIITFRLVLPGLLCTDISLINNMITLYLLEQTSIKRGGFSLLVLELSLLNL